MPLIDSDNPNLLNLESGVRLTLRPPSNFAIRARQEQHGILRPEPPMVWIEDKGREEPNASDPDYQWALAMHEAKLSEIITDTMIATATSIASMPDGYEGPESEWFADMLAAINIEVSPLKMGRYIQWLKYHAAREQELSAMVRYLFTLAGTPEAEVQAVMEDFKSVAERRTTSRTPAGADSGNRPGIR